MIKEATSTILPLDISTITKLLEVNRDTFIPIQYEMKHDNMNHQIEFLFDSAYLDNETIKINIINNSIHIQGLYKWDFHPNATPSKPYALEHLYSTTIPLPDNIDSSSIHSLINDHNFSIFIKLK